jgi:2'-5' RNA ligase
MPENNIYKKLSNLISLLSEEYSCPDFQPHVTLIGKIIGKREKVIEKTKKLTSEILPFKLYLNSVNFLDEYYKCLFMKVKKTNPIINANNKAKKIFNKNSLGYFPHLSLLYGNFPIKSKKKIVPEVQEELEKIDKLEFSVEDLHLYSTKGTVHDWYKIGRFPLNICK